MNFTYCFIEYHVGSMRRLPKKRPLVRWMSSLIAVELGA